MHPKMLSVALLISMAINCAAGEAVYETSANLCDRCKCQTRATTYFINCTSTQMQYTLANWPAEAAAPNFTRIIAHFNSNVIQRLEPLPETDLELIVYYAHNGIEALDSGLFTNCINVTSLDLSYNKIKSDVLITDVFRGEYNNSAYEPLALRTLNLAHNELHTIGKNVFEHLQELRSLDLSDNRFRIIDHITYLSFQKLTKLEYLNLANNRLIHLNNTGLHFMTQLRILDLSGNSLDFIPDAVKDVGATLRTLRIDSNPIIEISVGDLEGMDSLVEISAANLSQINEIKPYAFGAVKNLVKIDLSRLGANVILSDHLFNDSLRELNMSNSNMELIPPQLLNWTQLTVLDLRGNQLYCTCDLQNVTAQLQDVVKRDQDAAYCFDYKRYKQYEMYSLNEIICFEQDEYLASYGSIASTERILRMTLLSTSVLLIVCLVIAAWLGYVRCYKNQINYGFATSVTYGPIPRTY